MKCTAPLLLLACWIFSGCNQDPKNKSHGPILLGDSATIVTERDPKLLQDRFQDLKLPVSETEDEDQPAAAAADTAQRQPAAPVQPEGAAPVQAAPSGKGLTVAFKELTVFIPDISTRSFGRPDLRNARGATYELSGGNLAGNVLRFSGATIQKVTQRYQTILVLRDGSDRLPLESLSYTSPFQSLSGNGGSFRITGLEPSRLDFIQARPAAIRNAVTQAARRQRLSRQDTRDWQDAVRNIRAANQAPSGVQLRSVTWRIEGKDGNGKNFSKELRIDLPLE